jgi:predicted small lipoprotein YifL
MKPMKVHRFSQSLPSLGLLVILALLLITASGCGRKGPVRPALLPLPAAPENIALQQRGDSMLLSWDIPNRNQDGSALTDLQGFRISRMRFEAQKDCPECRDTSSLLDEIDLDYLRQAQRVGNRLYFGDGALQTGFGYRYHVVPFTHSGREGARATIQSTYLPPPPAPTGLLASGLDRMARLQWQGVTDQRPEAVLMGYRVYRRLDEQLFPPQPVNRLPVLEPGYNDFGLENGRRYHYSVTTVVRLGELTVESALSESTAMVPEAGR